MLLKHILAWLHFPHARGGGPSSDLWTEAERNLIAQGVDPKKVRRAAKLVRKLDRMGQLPFNIEHGDGNPHGRE